MLKKGSINPLNAPIFVKTLECVNGCIKIDKCIFAIFKFRILYIHLQISYLLYI